MKLVVAILETMWGDPGEAPPHFRINPNNKSGKRLYDLVGPDAELLVTNACKECVSSASEHGKPDSAWLEKNLKDLGHIDVLLVCGRVAQKTYLKCDYCAPAKVIYMPHPAARFLWTRELMEKIRRQVQRGLRD